MSLWCTQRKLASQRAMRQGIDALQPGWHASSSVRYLTIHKTCEILGLERMRFARTRRDTTGTLGPPGRQGGFWARYSPEQLEALYWEAKDHYRQRIKHVRHDFPENHEAATQLIGAWQQFKKLMRLHGITPEGC